MAPRGASPARFMGNAHDSPVPTRHAPCLPRGACLSPRRSQRGRQCTPAGGRRGRGGHTGPHPPARRAAGRLGGCRGALHRVRWQRRADAAVGQCHWRGGWPAFVGGVRVASKQPRGGCRSMNACWRWALWLSAAASRGGLTAPVALHARAVNSPSRPGLADAGRCPRQPHGPVRAWQPCASGGHRQRRPRPEQLLGSCLLRGSRLGPR